MSATTSTWVLFLPNIVNGVFLVFSIGLAIIIMRAGVSYSMAYGDYEIQEKYKWVILRAILAMVAIGLAAVLFNIFQFFFE